MTTIIAKCRGKPKTVDDLLEPALDLIMASRKEEGNISYDFYTEISDSG